MQFNSTVRSLRKAPALTAVAIASLALGIGANITVFSVVREMILDDLSASHPDRLARIEGLDASYSLYRQLRTAGAFHDLAFHRGFGDQIWRTGTRSEIAWRLTTSANFFDVLGIRPDAGRLYSQADEGRDLAVASYGFWRKRLHSDTHAIGQPIRLGEKRYTLIGVLPRDYRSVFGHGVAPELFLADPGNSDPRDHLSTLFGRLNDGVSLEQTSQAFNALAERFKTPGPAHRKVELHPMSGFRANAAKQGDDRLLLMFFVTLFGVAGMLALIGCSNVAGLLMVRTLNRQRELAIRKALGATRIQILSPLLAEGLALISCGSALGLALDAVLRSQLSELRWPSAYGIPFEFHFQSDAGLFVYAFVTSLAALLVSIVLPVLRATDVELNWAMKQGDPSFSLQHWDLRNAFVVLQVALSIVLLTVSSVFTRSLLHLAIAGPGFDVTHTLVAVIHPLPGRYDSEHAWDLRQQVLQRVTSMPGVVSVTSAGMLPLMGEVPGSMLRRQGDQVSALRDVYVLGAGENYFNTLSIPILRGRDLQISDRNRKPIPVIVNRTLVHDFFSETDPIGQHLLLGREQEDVLVIVGVAADFKMRTLGEADKPALFKPDMNGQLLIRVAGNPAQWIEPLRSALGQVDDTAALDVRPLEDAVAGALFPMRVATGFLVSLSTLGLLLSLIGLYSFVSYAVGRRTRELGIRAALGASRQRILCTTLRDGAAILSCGALIGAPLALLTIRPLVDMLPVGVNPWSPAPFLEIILLLLSTGAAATWIPARRAAKVDPAIVLRQD